MLCIGLASTGCFEFIRSERVARVCKPEAARSAGERDARKGRDPAESYAAICGVSEESLNRMYQDAYERVREASGA